MATAPIFRKALGLNNVTEPHRLRYEEDGSCFLAEAVNVIIDDSGSVKRRYGTEQKVAGACHSLWSWGEYCFFVAGGQLFRFYPNATQKAVLVHPSCGDAEMFWEEFAGKIYCNNGAFRAVLQGTNVSSWDAKVPLQYKADSRVLGMPDTFSKMCSYASRMYLVSGQYLWESEPGNPSCYNLGTGYLDFGEPILDVIAVTEGLYVSTVSYIYFLKGTSSENFIKIKAYDAPMVAGTCRQIHGDDIGTMFDFRSAFDGMCAVWVTQKGVCFGASDGRVYNVSSRNVVFDKALYGAGVVMPGQYLFSLEVI